MERATLRQRVRATAILGVRFGLALAIGGGTAPAAAAVITVTTLADDTVVDGHVTLREAMLAANTDSSVDGSTAGSGADQIVFAVRSGVIVLGGTQLPTVTAPLAMLGPGASRLAVDGAARSRILEVADGVSLAMTGLTLRNGRTGGAGAGILSAGTLSLSDMIVKGNAAVLDGGGLSTDGAATITNSTFSSNSALNGAGIANEGLLHVTGSTLTGNFTGGIAHAAGGGGAVGNFYGTLVMSGSTLSANSATNGAGVVNLGTVTLTNCTLSLNQAVNGGGGVSTIPGTALTVIASTIVGNRANGLGLYPVGGGIHASGGLVILQGSLVAENIRLAARSDVYGTVHSGSSFNLIGVDTGLAGIGNGSNANQIGTAAAPLSPSVGPLQDNGGRTATHALIPGSPAIDRGSGSGCPATDQRDLLRPIDGNGDLVARCDIGAYEWGATEPGGDLIFRDGFEAQDFSMWSAASTDGGDLATSADAALRSSAFGMQGLLNDRVGLYVQDDSPADENRYRARFHLDPNGFDPGVALGALRTRIFLAFDESPIRRVLAIVLRLRDGQYSVMARARLDDDSQADTEFHAITDAPHFIEVDWVRASGSDANDGSLQLWIDGVAAGGRYGLDNSRSAVDFARIGALGVKAGASGTIYWDEFESRRQTYIGP